jgi:hypothetical protein
MKTLVCAATFLLCIGTGERPTVNAPQVTSIAIRASVGGLGPGANYQTTITPRLGWFERTDGTRVSTEAVTAFVEALSQPPAATFDFGGMAIDAGRLRAEEPGMAENALGDARFIPSAASAFSNSFLDAKAFDDWYARSWLLPKIIINDYYPQLQVDVTEPTGVIRISSGSQQPYCVPFAIERNGSVVHTWEPTLSRAIAGLLPAEAVLRSELNGDSIVSKWADNLARGPAVTDAIGRDGVACDTAQKLALSLDTLVVQCKVDRGFWNGFVSLRGTPGIRYLIYEERQTSPDRFLALLREQRIALLTVGDSVVLTAILGRLHGYAIEVQSGARQDSGYSGLMNRNGYVHMAKRLRAELKSSTLARFVGIKDGNIAATWFLFPNGDTLLVQADAGFVSSAFSPSLARRIPIFPESDYGEGFTAALFRPDGSVDWR